MSQYGLVGTYLATIEEVRVDPEKITVIWHLEKNHERAMDVFLFGDFKHAVRMACVCLACGVVGISDASQLIGLQCYLSFDQANGMISMLEGYYTLNKEDSWDLFLEVSDKPEMIEKFFNLDKEMQTDAKQ